MYKFKNISGIIPPYLHLTGGEGGRQGKGKFMHQEFLDPPLV